jgi:hypothetical protein
MNRYLLFTRDSEKLASIRESAASGRPMRWIRAQKLPDYAYFPHNVHVTIPPADRSASIACVRELERKRLASTMGAPAGDN